MKKITFILLLITTNLLHSQTNIKQADTIQIGLNVLTPSEFNNILVYGATLENIMDSKGNQTTMESLFGNPSSINIDSFGDFIDYKYPGVDINFSSMFSENGEMEISSFHIINNNASITIKGISITLGDNINKLGHVKYNERRDGSYSINYQSCEGCDSFIVIEFDQITKLITRIYLLIPT